MGGKHAYLIPFSHLDLFWAGEELECLSRGSRIITRAMNLCQRFAEFRFLIEDVVFVAYFLRNHPEKRDELRRLVQTGQIEVGPKWTGIHQCLQLGEDLIRNCLHGMAYTEEMFGTVANTVHLGDLPSWTPQYPQLARGLGISHVISTRCGPRHIPLFYWQALDGTSVLTWYAVRGYHWFWSRHFESSEAAFDQLEKELEEINELTNAPVLAHWGIDLVLPPKGLVDRVAEWNKSRSITLQMATPTEYFSAVSDIGDLPVLTGEAPSLWPYLEPGYTQIVPLDVQAVNSLVCAETLTSLTCCLGLRSYPAKDFARSWQLLLQGMDHNYPATGADDTSVRKRAYRLQAIETAQWMIEESLRLIAERVLIPEFPGVNRSEVIPIVVVNSLAWDRREVARVHVTYHGDIHAMEVGRYRRFRLVDEQGKKVAFQQIDVREGVAREDTLLLEAEVPSLGYRTYYLIPEGCRDGTGFQPKWEQSRPMVQDLPATVERDDDVYVSPHYRLRVNANTGEVSVWTLAGELLIDRSRLAAFEEHPENMTFRDRLTGRVFENAVDSVDLVENGPIRARIVVRGKILSSPVVQEIVLYRHHLRIDVIDHIDWRDVRPVRVQQLFPTGLTECRIEYGVPFGSNRVGNELPNCGPVNNDEMPEKSWHRLRECIHWVDLRSESQDMGMMVASDRRSFEVSSPTLRCNILRMCKSNFEVHITEKNMERAWRGQLGITKARFTLLPHKGDWREEALHRLGWELNNPLLCTTSNDGETAKEYLPSYSFLRELGKPYVMSAFKQAEDGEGFVLRFFETTGVKGKARINLNMSPALATRPQDEDGVQAMLFEPTNLRETPTGEASLSNGVSLPVGPYEIKTLRFQHISQR